MAPQEIQHHDQFDTPAPVSLSELVSALKEELGSDGGLDSDHVDVNRVLSMMEAYKSNATDWHKYALFDRSRAYTRNLVDDGNGKFNLIVLAWTEGQGSPIHDHAGSHCIMKILDGELSETIYEWPETATEAGAKVVEDITSNPTPTKGDDHHGEHAGHLMNVKRSTTLSTDGVTYIHDKIGLHRIANPSSFKGAVSLHLYTPPYDMCKTFNELTGTARSSGRCVFYSKGGHRVESCPSVTPKPIAKSLASSKISSFVSKVMKFVRREMASGFLSQQGRVGVRNQRGRKW